jgi:hypothetical protein
MGVPEKFASAKQTPRTFLKSAVKYFKGKITEL